LKTVNIGRNIDAVIITFFPNVSYFLKLINIHLNRTGMASFVAVAKLVDASAIYIVCADQIEWKLFLCNLQSWEFELYCRGSIPSHMKAFTLLTLFVPKLIKTDAVLVFVKKNKVLVIDIPRKDHFTSQELSSDICLISALYLPHFDRLLLFSSKQFVLSNIRDRSGGTFKINECYLDLVSDFGPIKTLMKLDFEHIVQCFVDQSKPSNSMLIESLGKLLYFYTF
jgi:hypothetical protein